MANVGAECQHEKDGAQHVFPLGAPCHRFYVQRMNCEQRRNRSASPQSPCHLSQYEKQQHDSDGVQKNVGEMMPGRPQSGTADNRTCAKRS